MVARALRNVCTWWGCPWFGSNTWWCSSAINRSRCLVVYRRHLITPKGRSLASAGEYSFTATPDWAVQQRHQMQQFTNGITLHLVEVHYALTTKQTNGGGATGNISRFRNSRELYNNNTTLQLRIADTT